MINILSLAPLLMLCAPVMLWAAAQPVTRDTLIAGSTLAAMPRQEGKTIAKNSYFLLDALLIHFKLATAATLESHKEHVRNAWKTAHLIQRINIKRVHQPLRDSIEFAKLLISYATTEKRHLDVEKKLQSILTNTHEMTWPTVKLTEIDYAISALQKQRYKAHDDFLAACYASPNENKQERMIKRARVIQEEDAFKEQEFCKQQEQHLLRADFARDLIDKLKNQAEIELFPLDEI